VISVQNLQADLAGGQVNSSGKVEVFTYKYPTLDLKATLAGSRLKIYPFQYVKVRGDLAVEGDQRPYLISGSTIVDSGMVKEKVLGQKQGDTTKTLQYTPASSGSKGATDDIPLFKLKIDVNADRNILVQNDLFDAELKAHVTIINTLDAPRILGTADMIQGKMTFKDHQFQVQSASANFDNPSTLIPHVNMSATTEVGNTKVNLNTSGRMNNLKFDLTSNPAMSESEILSLLSLGGGSLDNRNRYAGVQTDYSAVQQGEAAALVLQTMDFNRDLQDKTGFEIQLDESINPLLGQSIFNSKTPIEQTAEPKLVVRRRIGDKFSVSYGSTVGVGTDKESDFNAEYHLTPGLSAIGVYENYETQETTQLLNQNSYGLDLKLEKRFK
jgi:translocation and assembly module TamB